MHSLKLQTQSRANDSFFFLLTAMSIICLYETTTSVCLKNGTLQSDDGPGTCLGMYMFLWWGSFVDKLVSYKTKLVGRKIFFVVVD